MNHPSARPLLAHNIRPVTRSPNQSPTSPLCQCLTPLVSKVAIRRRSYRVRFGLACVPSD